MGRLVFATGVGERLRGLLLTKPDDTMLLLVPCDDIHTFGMRYAIDVAFLDEAGFVLESHRDVLPRQRRRCKGARAVVERFSRPRCPWYDPGDCLEVSVHADEDWSDEW